MRPSCRVTLDLPASSFHVPIKGLLGQAALCAGAEEGAPAAAAIKTMAAENLAYRAISIFSSLWRLFVARLPSYLDFLRAAKAVHGP
jgi:hypothetical protein